MPSVTIGYIPRDRFSTGAGALRQLFEQTPPPFRLITFDPQMPARYRRELDAVLAGRDNVVLIETGKFVTSNEFKNIAARESDSEYLCLVENDAFVHEGWLERLIAACEEMPADAAVPLIYERDAAFEQVHFDDRLGFVQKVQTPNGPGLKILPREEPLHRDLHATRRRVEMIETHCVLFRRSAYERIGGMDASLSTSRSEVDLSLALYAAGAAVAFEPTSRITFRPPPPVEPEERYFYVDRWDKEKGVLDQQRIERRYNLVDFPASIVFCDYRLSLATETDPSVQVARFDEFQSRLRQATDEVARVVPPGSAFVLVDDVQWDARVVGRDRKPLPFLERDGHYWGSPPDDATAVSELERMRSEGAEYIVFGWPSFWWLESYGGLRDYLGTNFRNVLKNERVLIWDLRAHALAGSDHASE